MNGRGEIRTISGTWVNVLNPDPNTIHIGDIAHSLSMQCRFAGHMREFYSVARHSLNCAYLMEDLKKKKACLLHDASEAYLLDIPSPIKSELTNYKQIEHRLMSLIAEKYGFLWPLEESVASMDKFMLELEWDNLILRKKPELFVIKHIGDTESEFLDMFKYYMTL